MRAPGSCVGRRKVSLSSPARMSTIDNMRTTTRNRLTRKDRGPGGKRTRSQRSSNTPVDDDEQTQIEAELASSGRSDTDAQGRPRRRPPDAPAAQPRNDRRQ